MSVALEVRDVSKSFGGLRALDGCSLSIEEGAIAGLIGPNGSGKTTLFNVVTGYVRPDRGSVAFRGRPINGLSPSKIFSAGIGRTFQITRIFSRLRVIENMLVATQRHEGWLRGIARRAASRDEIGRAMELLEFVGLEELAGNLAGTLSFGQRKLLELAYLLVADPELILLDEPAGGINPTLVNQLRDRIKTLNKEQRKTFLVVEHNMEFVMSLCDVVTVMHQGCAIVRGTPDEVRKDSRVLDAYLGGGEVTEPDNEAVVGENGR